MNKSFSRWAIIKLQPERWLQWSAFVGASAEALAEVYKGAEQVWVEPTPELLERSAAAAKRGWLQRLTGAPKITVSKAGEVAPEANPNGSARSASRR